tara:strand:- start:2912 stop:3211 length:300 start_codon:yes stop_codon:yes gene_type:complete
MNKPYSEFPDVLIDPSRFRDRIAALLVTAGYLGDRGYPILSADIFHDKTTISIRAADFLGLFEGPRSYVSGSKDKQYRHYYTTLNGIEITACEPVEGDA